MAAPITGPDGAEISESLSRFLPSFDMSEVSCELNTVQDLFSPLTIRIPISVPPTPPAFLPDLSAQVSVIHGLERWDDSLYYDFGVFAPASALRSGSTYHAGLTLPGVPVTPDDPAVTVNAVLPVLSEISDTVCDRPRRRSDIAERALKTTETFVLSVAVHAHFPPSATAAAATEGGDDSKARQPAAGSGSPVEEVEVEVVEVVEVEDPPPEVQRDAGGKVQLQVGQAMLVVNVRAVVTSDTSDGVGEGRVAADGGDGGASPLDLVEDLLGPPVGGDPILSPEEAIVGYTREVVAVMRGRFEGGSFFPDMSPDQQALVTAAMRKVGAEGGGGEGESGGDDVGSDSDSDGDADEADGEVGKDERVSSDDDDVSVVEVLDGPIKRGRDSGGEAAAAVRAPPPSVTPVPLVEPDDLAVTLSGAADLV